MIQNLVNKTNNAVRSGPKKEAPQQGSEQRSSILPNMIPSGLGFFGSPYNAADAMVTPTQLNIKVGNSIGDVVNAVKGVGFYTDQIGFGAPSTGLTRGMPLKPLGINYFIKTGATCSNGASMWEYIEGITKGDALGKKIQEEMKKMGLPPLQGLAPGMIEDAKNALNPSPLINSLFGSGYPECELRTFKVGDSYGRIADPDTGEEWIADPKTARFDGTGYVQDRWVQRKDAKGNPISISRDKWVSTPKTHNPDGTPIRKEGFTPLLENPTTIVVVGILCLVALSFVKK
jgi:hypothetical protein